MSFCLNNPSMNTYPAGVVAMFRQAGNPRKTQTMQESTPMFNTLPHRRQNGVSLIVVLLLLVIVSMLGLASMQIALMGERGARNDRDMQIAWQSAEAALVDAEIDLKGPNNTAKSRTARIQSNPQIPVSGCDKTQDWRGFCAPESTVTSPAATAKKPTWLTVDFTDTGNNAPSVALGTFTGRSYKNASDSLGTGIQPALAPRYIMEDVSTADAANAGGGMVTATYKSAATTGKSAAERLYRVTAVGFGPRSDTQAVVQAIFRN